jgi:hypothetical protein
LAEILMPPIFPPETTDFGGNFRGNGQGVKRRKFRQSRNLGFFMLAENGG